MNQVVQPQVTVEIRRGRVWIVSGVQSFMLAYGDDDTENAEELAWYAEQLRVALFGRPMFSIPSEESP